MTVHIIGAGMAGLAAAVRFGQRGRKVTVWEAAGHAGGRVRSIDCPVIGRTIDNGTHLVLSGNKSVRDYVKTIGASKRLVAAENAAFDFVDIKAKKHWTVRPSHLPLPLWLLSPSRRIPGARLGEYMRFRKLAQAGHTETVADCVGTSGALYDRFWKPLTLAVMNADPSEAAAAPMMAALRETMLRGAAHSTPMMVKKSLSHTFVDLACAYITKKGGDIRYGNRLSKLVVLENQVHALAFGDDVYELEKDDQVVLALPPWALSKVWPGADLPMESRGILNVHYRVDDVPADMPPLVGVVGGRIHWVAVRGDVVSVTISAADDEIEKPSEALARQLWPEVAQVLNRDGDKVPPYRVIKERRATVLQTPAAQQRRPRPRTGLGNVFLAGDWTATGIPATIESAVRSGFDVADVAANMDF